MAIIYPIKFIIFNIFNVEFNNIIYVKVSSQIKSKIELVTLKIYLAIKSYNCLHLIIITLHRFKITLYWSKI